jgi:ankyrin repeat protein
LESIMENATNQPSMDKTARISPLFREAAGDFLLAWAANIGFAAAIAPLVSMGAHVHQNNFDDEILWNPAFHGYTKTVKALLDPGADIHAGNDRALRSAAEYGHADTVRLLLERGADVHARKDEAMYLASLGNHRDTVAVLLLYGADPYAVSEKVFLCERESVFN